jgi:4-hydroxybenzoyl-CoA reductase subunit beta
LSTRCFYYDQSEFWRNSLGYCLKFGDGICHAAPELSKCTAIFCSDLAPLLIALDATIELYSSTSLKKLSLAHFYRNDGINHLQTSPFELLTTIIIPFNPATKSAHGKLRSRASIDFAIANVGMALTMKNDLCAVARIVVGAISSAPIDASETAKELVGQKINEGRIQNVAEKISSLIHPMPNVDGSVNYRKKMIGELVKKTLRQVIP